MTGNDLSTLYAPLLRDGRMDKFLWAPDAEVEPKASTRPFTVIVENKLSTSLIMFRLKFIEPKA